MIEQKDAMQLIGEWGYTPKGFEDYLVDQRERARGIGEKAGMTTYSSLLSLCKFAITGDATEAMEEDERDFPVHLKDSLNNELHKLMMDNPDFAIEVITRVYDACSPYKDIKDAEMALRKNIISTVAPLLMGIVVDMGVRTAEQILECLIGMDSVKNNKAAIVNIGASTVTIERLVERVLYFKDDMKACGETDDEVLNNMADSVLGNVDELVSAVSQNMLSIVDKPPHEWVKYATDFGRMMAGFVLAMSYGYVTYDEYDSIVNNFKKMVEQPEKRHSLFGRN
jgi:hypothetical protein